MCLTAGATDLNQEADRGQWISNGNLSGCDKCFPCGKVQRRHYIIAGGILLASVAIVVLTRLAVEPFVEPCKKAAVIFFNSCNITSPNPDGCMKLPSANCLDLCHKHAWACMKMELPSLLSILIGCGGVLTTGTYAVFICFRTSCACINKIRNCFSEYKEIPESARQGKENDL